MWECPDIMRFRTPDGGALDVLVVSAAIHDSVESSNVLYFVGRFDGTRFLPLPGSGHRPLDYGKDFYAAQSWSGLSPRPHLLSGWMGNWAYSHHLNADGYRGCLSLPRSVGLQKIDGTWQLHQTPVAAISALYGPALSVEKSSGSRIEWSVGPQTPFLVRTEWSCLPGDSLQLSVGDEQNSWFRLSLSVSAGAIRLGLDRSHFWNSENDAAGISEFDVERLAGVSPMEMRIYVDTCSIELFLDGGRVVATELVPWTPGRRRIVASRTRESKGGKPWEVIPLRSVRID
jgi:sucrose-6-phosphate hydrolase SacC (GH32 family)